MNVQSHFLDSGAYSLVAEARRYHARYGGSKWEFYDTAKFWAYMRGYAAFVKKYGKAIDLYANVDVIHNPELTWRNQQWLEARGLHPVPVVHYGTDLSWLQHYLNKGYAYIGIGGLVVRSRSGDMFKLWLDKVFDLVCNTMDRVPRAKLHGFGVTSFWMMRRYPWWSVDSTAWCRFGSFGTIVVPRTVDGRFSFDVDPMKISVSQESPDRADYGQHFYTLPESTKQHVQRWLKKIKVPLGKANKNGKVLEEGVLTGYGPRHRANLLYFEHFQRNLPKYPWPFQRAVVELE